MKLLITFMPALPVISAILSLLISSRSERQAAIFSVLSAVIVFVLTIVSVGIVMAGVDIGTVGGQHGWGMLLSDPLSSIMGVLIAGISLVVHLYSIRYMVEEAGYARFFILLDLMAASLLIMVSAADLVTLVVSWHLISVLLYFLLGHDTRRQSTFRYAFWTFFTYRIGDVALISAAAVLFHAYGTLSLNEIFSHIQNDSVMATTYGIPVTSVAATFLAFAALARSAQFLLDSYCATSRSN